MLIQLAALLGPSTHGMPRQLLRAMTHALDPRGERIERWPGPPTSEAGLALARAQPAPAPALPNSVPANGREDPALATLHTAQGELAAILDARLDNLPLLCRCLALPRDSTPAQVVLAAYLHWGPDFAAWLEGDFALVLWDGTRRRLLCVRDPMGARPLAYLDRLRPFACASTLRPLLLLPHVQRQLDQRRVLQHLLCRPAAEPQRTFFRGIRRLPPAHWLAVEFDGGQRLQRYWTPPGGRTLHLPRAEDHAVALREALSRAVARRLPADSVPGAMLSGGLDSSSVVCLARQQRPGSDPALHTFSAVFPSLRGQALRRIDERQHVQAVLEGGGLQGHLLRGDRLLPLPEDLLNGPLADEPFFSPNLYINWAAYQRASALGLQVMLDGLGGDEVLSSGVLLLQALLLQGRMGRLWGHARAVGRATGLTTSQVIWRAALRPSLPPSLLVRARQLRGRSQAPPLVRPALARRLGVPLRPPAAPLSRDPRALHRAELLSGLFPRALELARRAAGLHGVEPRYPFLDRNVMELCLAIPAEERLRGGRHRSLLRRAMQGVLPEAVRLRPGKANLAGNFYRQLFGRQRVLMQRLLLERPGPLAPYVDLGQLRRQTLRCLDQPTAGRGWAQTQVYAACTLAHWLRYSDLAC